jgi:hypothetical protein
VLIQGPAAGSPAGMHAFIVGVSHYPYADGPNATMRGQESGIANLTGAARSASEVAAWLLNEYCNPDAPLAGIHILLSPVDGEAIHPDVEARMGAAAPATRDAVKKDFVKFRQACKRNRDNVAFVYVAGHGVQLNKRGAIVLLHDFAVDDEDLLYGAIDIAGCHSAMDEAINAHHQLWFADACRQPPETAETFEILSGAYKPGEEGLGQAESSPLFLAASSRGNAYATINGLTIFCKVLLAALRGQAAVAWAEECHQWHVPCTRLIYHLRKTVKELVPEQDVDTTGRVGEMVVHRLAEPPDVQIVANLRPEDAHRGAVATLLFDAKRPCQIDPSWPMVYRGDAGLYQLTVTVAPPFRDTEKNFQANPPRYICHLEVS